MKTAVFGHSFVRRLGVFLRREEKANTERLRRGEVPNTRDRRFGLRGNDRVYLYGEGGGTTASLENSGRFRRWRSYPVGRSRLRHWYQFDCIICQIGSNDLTPEDVCPEKVAKEVIQFAARLRRRHGAKKVLVSEALPRYYAGKRRGGIDRDTFNQRVLALNRELKSLSQTEQGVEFLPAPTLRRSSLSTFDTDGVHLNYDSGYRRYYRHIRGAIVKTLDQLRGCRI